MCPILSKSVPHYLAPAKCIRCRSPSVRLASWGLNWQHRGMHSLRSQQWPNTLSIRSILTESVVLSHFGLIFDFTCCFLVHFFFPIVLAWLPTNPLTVVRISFPLLITSCNNKKLYRYCFESLHFITFIETLPTACIVSSIAIFVQFCSLISHNQSLNQNVLALDTVVMPCRSP